jgi:hypothetical protein
LSIFSFDSGWQQLAFNEHRRTIEDRLAQCERLGTALREAVADWRFYPAVLALQAMRGINFTSAEAASQRQETVTRENCSSSRRGVTAIRRA